MAKDNVFDRAVDQHCKELEKAPTGGEQRAFGLPWWIPDWLIAQAIATALTALKALAKTDAAKALMKNAFLKLFIGIKTAYADDVDFTCD